MPRQLWLEQLPPRTNAELVALPTPAMPTASLMRGEGSSASETASRSQAAAAVALAAVLGSGRAEVDALLAKCCCGSCWLAACLSAGELKASKGEGKPAVPFRMPADRSFDAGKDCAAKEADLLSCWEGDDEEHELGSPREARGLACDLM